MVLLDNVSFGYGGAETLSDISLELAPGTFHFLTGPSGAGKTTLMRMLYLEHLPQRGALSLFGDNPAVLGREALTQLRRRIGVVFQDFRLLDHLSIAENIALPLWVSGQQISGQDHDVVELVRWVGLEGRANAYPPQLSAGEKQRAAIARAVIKSPDLILADEPTGNIDPDMGTRILRLLIELNRLGKTVVIATHDMALIRAAKSHVDVQILRLADGKLAQSGVAL